MFLRPSSPEVHTHLWGVFKVRFIFSAFFSPLVVISSDAQGSRRTNQIPAPRWRQESRGASPSSSAECVTGPKPRPLVPLIRGAAGIKIQLKRRSLKYEPAGRQRRRDMTPKHTTLCPRYSGTPWSHVSSLLQLILCVITEVERLWHVLNLRTWSLLKETPHWLKPQSIHSLLLMLYSIPKHLLHDNYKHICCFTSQIHISVLKKGVESCFLCCVWPCCHFVLTQWDFMLKFNSLKHVPSHFFLGRSSFDLHIKGKKSYFVCYYWGGEAVRRPNPQHMISSKGNAPLIKTTVNKLLIVKW